MKNGKAENFTRKGKGRPTGAKNKTTRELREFVSSWATLELANLDALTSRLTEAERLRLLVSILPYVLPKAEAEPTEVQAMQKPVINWGLPL